jgi:glycosyltransferase involved in cell wall biosynthesis
MSRDAGVQGRALHIALLSRSVIAHHLGGLETHGEALRCALAEFGHHVTTLTTTLPQGPDSVSDAYGETRYLHGSPPGQYSDAWGAELVKTLLALHERAPFDVIASQSAAAFPYLAARANLPLAQRIPTVLMNHGTVTRILPLRLRQVWREPARVILKRVPADLRTWLQDRQRYPQADHVTALSDADKRAICRGLGIRPQRVTVIPNGVNAIAFSPSRDSRVATRARLGLADDQTVIGVLARLELRKGQHTLLDALATPLLRDTFARHSVQVALIGDGPSRETLRARAARLGLADRVRFLGAAQHEDVPALLNAIDIVAQPSLAEGMPLALLEAMSCARAVVASDVGAIGKVLKDGVNGLLVPPNAPLALASALDRLIRYPDHAAELAARARADIVSRYDEALTMRRYEALLQEVVSRASR